jgi:hypothetical protein
MDVIAFMRYSIQPAPIPATGIAPARADFREYISPYSAQTSTGMSPRLTVCGYHPVSRKPELAEEQ